MTTSYYHIRNIGISEADAIHQRVATNLRAAGLTGQALDEAIAPAFRSILMSVDADRDAKAEAEAEKERSRAKFRIVGGNQ